MARKHKPEEIIGNLREAEIVLAALAEPFVTRGPPAHIRSDNGPEFIANAVQEWLTKFGVKTLYITPGSPWEDGYCESFNGSMRDELLNGEIFYTLADAQILIEACRRHYRPHSSLGYRPPAPEATPAPWRRRLFYTNTQRGARGGAGHKRLKPSRSDLERNIKGK